MPKESLRVFLPLIVAAALAVLMAVSGAALADTYEYDAHGRLTKVTFSDGSSITYTYDAAGNRTVVVQATP